MTYTLTILGCGVMGSAVMSAIYKAPKATSETAHMYPSKIITCNHNQEAADVVVDMIDKLGPSPNNITVESTWGKNEDAIKQSKLVILATKPYLVEPVLSSVSSLLKDKHIISLAAGWTIGQLSEYCPTVTRVMTNTPARYGAGCAVLSHNSQVSTEQKATVKELIGHVGTSVELPESNMDAATSLVGSGPAFTLLMIESMIEAGLQMGIPLKESTECSLQVLEGTVKMVRESGMHPGQLKHQVCTPGGTTIAGLCVMEDKGVKSGIIRGIEEAANKASQLGKKK